MVAASPRSNISFSIHQSSVLACDVIVVAVAVIAVAMPAAKEYNALQCGAAA